MKSQLVFLEKKHSEAKSNFDFEFIAELEMGKFRLF